MRADSLAPTTAAAPAPPGRLALWAGLLAAPVAFLFNLQTMYILVTMTCRSARPWLQLSGAATLLLAVAGGVLAWRNWRRSGVSWPGQGGDALARSRFMAALGLFASVLFSLVIIAQWMVTWVLGPCAGD